MSEDNNGQGQPGIPIDAYGRATIDPTKNVLDLVHAESRYQDSMREALEKFDNAMRDTFRDQQNTARVHDTKFQDYARESQEKLQNWMRDAELKRVDEISEVRETYEKRIADMLAESVRSTSTLVSSQLVQIQATFNDRVSKLEEFRWSSAGRSSVADPALSEALGKMASTLDKLESVSSRSGGLRMGMHDTNARMLAVVMALAATASPIVAIIGVILVTRGH